MIDQRQLQMALALAEEQHFGRAAERVNASQSMLSRSIAALEHEIGVALFERTSRRVTLTPAGEAYLLHALRALGNLDEARRAARLAAAGYLGKLTIGYMDLAIADFLPGLIAEFRKAQPDIVVDLLYGWRSLQEAQLLDGTIDIGFMVGPFLAKTVETFVYREQALVAVLPAGHRLASKDVIDLADLAQEHFVFGTYAEWRSLRDIVAALCAKAGFVADVIQEAPTRDGIFGYVAAGLGITIFTDVAFNVQRKDVVVRPLDVSEKVPIGVAWLKKPMSPAAGHFITMLRAGP